MRLAIDFIDNVLGSHDATHLVTSHHFAFSTVGAPDLPSRSLLFSQVSADGIPSLYAKAAKSWIDKRRVVARVKAGPHGADSRFIVTNLPGRPKTLYEKLYCARGQTEKPDQGVQAPSRLLMRVTISVMRAATLIYP
jgi:hypothetical protein